jgi:phenylpropionate dioxygenase-like ring-hydroxylating dioxygenase large terminal subunit
LTETPLFLRNLWYMAGHASSLKPGAMRREILCGEPVLLARRQDGTAFALRDICPHRAAPLSAGKFQDGDVECPITAGASGPMGCAR